MSYFCFQTRGLWEEEEEEGEEEEERGKSSQSMDTWLTTKNHQITDHFFGR